MKVSVIVTNYNYGWFISRSITSLADQSLDKREYEIIVVDDGSTDMSVRLLEPYMDMLHLVQLEHVGHLQAANEGFKMSRGQYVVRIDADDYVNKDFLKIESMILDENKEYAAVACDYYEVDTKGNRLARFHAQENPIACGVMFRREQIFEKGLYPFSPDIWADKLFLEHFKHSTYYLILPLYRYVKHENSLTVGGKLETANHC